MLQLEMFMFSVLYIVHVYIFEMTSFDKKKHHRLCYMEISFVAMFHVNV